jgi:hypothetical protein
VSKLRAAIYIALIHVVALAVVDAVLAPAPAPKQPDFIDAIFASRAVIAAIRIAVVFAALFLVLSVTALIAQRRWLTRVGPVEVSGEVSNLDAEILDLEQQVEEANRVIEALRQRLRVRIN